MSSNRFMASGMAVALSIAMLFVTVAISAQARNQILIVGSSAVFPFIKGHRPLGVLPIHNPATVASKKFIFLCYLFSHKRTEFTPHSRGIREKIARSYVALADLAENIIGISEVALDGRRSQVRTVETNEGNLIADALLWQAAQLASDFGVPEPDVALQNGGGIRNDDIRGPGEITELDTFDILPFSNFVTIVPDIPREQFKEILENAVSRVAFTDGRFAQISGFTMEWDPNGTAQVLDGAGNFTTPGTRIRTVILNDGTPNGTPIIESGTVVAGSALNIATIDFLARSGDQYPYRGASFTSIGVTYQQALSNYIQNALSGTITAADYPEGGKGRIASP